MKVFFEALHRRASVFFYTPPSGRLARKPPNALLFRVLLRSKFHQPAGALSCRLNTKIIRCVAIFLISGTPSKSYCFVNKIFLSNDDFEPLWPDNQIFEFDGCWRLLAVASGCWRQLAVASGCWRLLASAGGCWRLLAAACGCSRLFAAADSCWRLLAAAGCC